MSDEDIDKPSVRDDEILRLLKQAKEAAKPYYASVGEALIQRRELRTHKEFRRWIKRQFGMSLKKAEYYMDIAYKVRLEKAEDEAEDDTVGNDAEQH
jgi:hypothetical protein